MFDIGWTEMLTLAVLAIVVVGPKDLPKFLRAIGKIMRSVRSVANEFKQSFDQLADETELMDVTAKLNKAGNIPVDENGIPINGAPDMIWEDEKGLTAPAKTSVVPPEDKKDAKENTPAERPPIKVSGKAENDDAQS